MRLADYIFKFFTDRGAEEVFLITGGHSMFLNDAVARNKKLKYITPHHEQVATMSADAYSRLRGKPAIALVTAGPGSVNALNGVLGGWLDSAPMVIISGQSNYSVIEFQEKNNMRQYGVQGISINHFVKPITKFFVRVDDPKKIVSYLAQAYKAMTTGRPGPVWLDVPLDMQRAELSDEFLEAEEKKIKHQDIFVKQNLILSAQIKKVYQLIAQAKRPVFLFGQGVRLSGAVAEFERLADKIGIPILTSRLAIDLIDSSHRLYVGRPGTYGERAANFAVQNADLIITVGCRLAGGMSGHNPKDFGRNAKKIVVDADLKELKKPDFNIVLPIHNDVKNFLKEFLAQATGEKKLQFPKWVKICKGWRRRYPVVLPEYKNQKPINSYYFLDRLTHLASKQAYVMVDTGSCFHVAAQAWQIKKGQRFLTTGGLSSMGYWAAGIGVCVANDRKSTIVITGDGSLQMNIQELATVKNYKLPLKIFIFNNNGYLLMRHTQRNFFENRLIGEGPTSGVWCPDSLKIAKAYGIKGVRIKTVKEMDKKIREVLNFPGPVICDVIMQEWQLIVPRVASEKGADGKMVSRPYEDMFPYLPADELEDIAAEVAAELSGKSKK
jgi:acetolactate synthase-1/2/3 large subunit